MCQILNLPCYIPWNWRPPMKPVAETAIPSEELRGNADAPCESPWIKEIEKLREEIQDLMAQHQNLRRLRQVTTPSTSALDPWSDESVRKDQLADSEIKPIIEFKDSSDKKPSWQNIAPLHPTTKRYWALWDSLHLRNGVLYRKWESDDGKTFRWQLILPKTRVSTVLKELHGSPTGGHFGVMRTLQKVRERFYCNNVRSDVEKCCRICDPCAARKGPRTRTRGRLQLYNVGAPFERIAFDILGPLPRSSDGNNILVVMDYFTKWPDAYPIPDQEASTVTEVLVQHWISRFGVSLQLHSDKGRNFDSAVCKRLCEVLAIDKTRTTALHPQSDGMIERFNLTILNRLSLLVSSNQQDWDKKLSFFLLAYRSAIHETTGYSPSQMLFGRDLRLPADLLFSQSPGAFLMPEEYIEKLQVRLEEMHHLARERIGLASEKMKTRYDARATGHDFHEADKVWLWNPKRRKGLSPKLQTNWEGNTPAQIKDELDSVYGNSAQLFTTVEFWSAEFKRGRKSLGDVERSGPPNTATTRGAATAVSAVSMIRGPQATGVPERVSKKS
ncbi:retrovirus-related Pol polyprotein from transposon 412 [Trichonephila clavipes]|nr:retrovirus-related Pol polyprotein from transposon 412 [Trichonephila clavipes]